MNVTLPVHTNLKRLYHYQGSDIDRLRTIICDRLLYFSNPAQFNDPWDCKPFFSPPDLSNSSAMESHLIWYAENTRRHRRDVSEEQILKRLIELRNSPLQFRAIIENEINTAMSTMISDRFRIYCLSALPDQELMWAHYASKHSGVCLEFATENEDFCGAIKVLYSSDLPFYDLISDNEENNIGPLISKSAAWSYEEEYRAFALEGLQPFKHMMLTTNNSHRKLLDGTLRAVILGCLVNESLVHSIRALIEQSGQSIQLKRAIRIKNKYQLAITDA